MNSGLGCLTNRQYVSCVQLLQYLKTISRDIAYIAYLPCMIRWTEL